MWPKWLADTLDRSALESRPHRFTAKPQRVRDVDEGQADSPDVTDWDDVTGYDIHVGFGPESHDT